MLKTCSGNSLKNWISPKEKKKRVINQLQKIRTQPFLWVHQETDYHTSRKEEKLATEL